MTNLKKLMMFAATGLLMPGLATADVKVSKFANSPTLDKAPVSGNPARLRRTDEEQPGNEMPTLAMFKDGKSGLVFSMSTELNGVGAQHRMQLSLTKFSLVQDAAGKVMAQADIPTAKFVTANDGNEYRNANHPDAYPVMDGNLIAVEYNYQPNNTNNTERYMKVFNAAGVEVMGQTRVFQKNNDDASMAQDIASTATKQVSPTVTRLVGWRGANGNGSDDGWVSIHDLTCDAAYTSCTLAKIADLSVCPREERSHGSVSFGTDPNTVIATWTEGNTQPQRDGTWMAAVNVGQGQNGNNAQSRLLWKKQIDGRKDIDGIRTYSMRAKQARIMKMDTSGKLVPTDQVMWQSNDLSGNNNGNNKGGTNRRINFAVIEATAAGMKYVMPMTDLANTKLSGMDGTHNGMNFGMFGTTDALMPGVMMLGGSHTGGGLSAQARALAFDATTNTLVDAGMYQVGPYDRHLYPNYLGNNPGNQGRNYAGSTLVANPYLGMNGNTDAHLMLFATTGKDPAEMTNPAIKLSGYISVLPVTSTPKVTPPTGGGSDTTPPGGTDPSNPDDNGDPAPGSALGGCSAGHGTSGALTFLLIGLAAFIRRRR
jgi:uncharacterized protein (TIGR03382 family)